MTRFRDVEIAMREGGKMAVPCFARCGPFAVTAIRNVDGTTRTDAYNVTHVPSGYGALTWGMLDLPDARRVMRALAAVPGNWNFTTPEKAPKRLMARARKVRDRAVAAEDRA